MIAHISPSPKPLKLPHISGLLLAGLSGLKMPPFAENTHLDPENSVRALTLFFGTQGLSGEPPARQKGCDPPRANRNRKLLWKTPSARLQM
jgi:hypothetical protein